MRSGIRRKTGQKRGTGTSQGIGMAAKINTPWIARKSSSLASLDGITMNHCRMGKRSNKWGPPETCSGCQATLWARQLDPVDHPIDSKGWSNIGWSTGSGGLAVKRSRGIWMSEGSMFFAAGPSGPPFDPEGQAPTLWARTSWSTGSEGHASNSLTTCAGSTPVSFWSSPWWRTVNRVWSNPNRCRTVAWKSRMWTGSLTML
jgi:hypothetical protein